MKLIHAPERRPSRLGILPGSFNPPTRAHLALAHAALIHVDDVLLVVPEEFPHKAFDGATLEQRVEMLSRATADEPNIYAAVSRKGLFIEIAAEAREHYSDASLYFLCGRDAAERIIEWDYGEPGAIERMLDVFHLLVAPRQGVYVPPPWLAHGVHTLALNDYDECSATRVRDAIRSTDSWVELVPEAIVDLVAAIYSPTDASRNARSL